MLQGEKGSLRIHYNATVRIVAKVLVLFTEKH